MRKRSKLLLAAMTATLMLGALVGTTTATRFSVRVQQSYRATWSTFVFATTAGSITCAVTLEGSLHSRTFSKVGEALIGYITGASLNTCNGTAAFKTEALPWPVRYESFTGTLPSITALKLRIAMMRWQVTNNLGVACTYQSSQLMPVRAIIHTGAENRRMENMQMDESALIEASTCGNGFLRGTSGILTIAGETTQQSITLVA